MSNKGTIFTHRDWARQRAITPTELYSVGHTDTYVKPQEYFETVLPLFVDMSPDQQNRIRISYREFLMMVKGGILESNQTANVSSNSQVYYVKDSYSNRDRLQEMTSLTDYHSRKTWLRCHLLTITCPGAWGVLLDRLQKIQLRLTMYNWQVMFTSDNELDLTKYLRIGSLLDSGQLPLPLVNSAVRMIAIRLYEWLVNKHESNGYIAGKRIQLVYASRVVMKNPAGKQWQLLYQTSAMRPGVSCLSTIAIPKKRHQTTKKS